LTAPLLPGPNVVWQLPNSGLAAGDQASSIWGEVWPALIYIYIYIYRERERERYTSRYIIYGVRFGPPLIYMFLILYYRFYIM
jgi:hypothetical protein